MAGLQQATVDIVSGDSTGNTGVQTIEQTFIQAPLQNPEEALAAWIMEDRLYAIVDGLNQPDLAALAEQQHPQINTALYRYHQDPAYQLISPHIIRVDQRVYDWLMPIIAGEAQWGWFMLPRARYKHWPFNALLAKLLEHFRISAIAPSRKEGETSCFRLQDPQAIHNWLQAVDSRSIAALFGPLEALLMGDNTQLNYLKQSNPQQPEVTLQLPVAPWPEAVFAALAQQQSSTQLQQYHAHLWEHHPQVQQWADKNLQQHISDNIHAAKKLGFDTPRMIAQYLSLSVELGADFIHRDDGQWARNSLAQTHKQESTSRLDTLIKAAYQYLDRRSPS